MNMIPLWALARRSLGYEAKAQATEGGKPLTPWWCTRKVIARGLTEHCEACVAGR
jgi:hypothetical protein